MSTGEEIWLEAYEVINCLGNSAHPKRWVARGDSCYAWKLRNGVSGRSLYDVACAVTRPLCTALPLGGKPLTPGSEGHEPTAVSHTAGMCVKGCRSVRLTVQQTPVRRGTRPLQLPVQPEEMSSAGSHCSRATPSSVRTGKLQDSQELEAEKGGSVTCAGGKTSRGYLGR